MKEAGVGLDVDRPMRVYLEAVRDAEGRLGLQDLEREMHRRGIFPDGMLSQDLDRLCDAGLVEEDRVDGSGRPQRRWRITADGLAKLVGYDAGRPEAPSPEPEVFGVWHRIGGFRYQASCHSVDMPEWAIWWGSAPDGNDLIGPLVCEWVRRRHSRPPWVVVLRRVRRVYWRRVDVHRVVTDDADEAGAWAAHLERELRAGRLPRGRG